MKYYEFVEKAPKIGRLVVVEGTERLLADRALELLAQRLLEPAERDFNFERMNASELDSPGRVEAAINAMPFLGARRVVVVRGCETLRAEPRRALLAIAEAAPEGNTLVLEDLVSPGKRTKPEPLGSLLGRAALRIDTSADASVRARFIGETLADLAAFADATALSALAENERDLAGLRTDLEKLALLGHRIELDDVVRETLVTDDVKAWEYSRAIVEGRTSDALALAFDLFEADPRGAAIPLVSALAQEFGLVWELCRPGGELPPRVRWRERALRPIARRMGERRAKRGYELAVRCFEAIVTGRADDARAAVELLTASSADR